MNADAVKEIAKLKEQIEELRKQIKSKEDRKTPSREWHMKNRRVLLK